MPLQKNTFVPGINREGTAYDNEGGWFDCNLIRFRAGRPEKFGGWGKLLSATYQGTARALHNFISLAGTKYLGIGTHFKYYIVENNDAFNDITPIRKTVGAGQTDTTATTFAKVGNDDATITVTNNSHGAVQNDFVTFSGAASLGGNITAAVLNQEYQIATVTDGNTYTIEAKDTSGNTVLANSSDSGTGGGSVVSTYQINTGLDVFVSSTGWGANSWGSSGWGSTTPLSDTNQLRIWTHDNYGEDLILNVRGGGVYRWVENNGTSTRASLLS